jgi:bacterioferritin (cytochrome b1)
VMRDLYLKAPKNFKGKCEWPFEMREIEHSLCEYDKYLRVMKKEGRPRSTFTPLINRKPTQMDLFEEDLELQEKLLAKIKRERVNRAKARDYGSRHR